MIPILTAPSIVPKWIDDGPLAQLGVADDQYTITGLDNPLINAVEYHVKRSIVTRGVIDDLISAYRRRLAVRACEPLSEGHFLLAYCILRDDFFLDVWDWFHPNIDADTLCLGNYEYFNEKMLQGLMVEPDLITR